MGVAFLSNMKEKMPDHKEGSNAYSYEGPDYKKGSKAYGYCQCGCGRKTARLSNGEPLKYISSHNPIKKANLAKIRQKARREEQKKHKFKKFSKLSMENLIFSRLRDESKIYILKEIHHYSEAEARELIEIAEKESRKAKLSSAKTKISKKAQDLYGKIPSDEARQPIPDEVKMFVWQRDGGKCVKCGSRENLEYDHIIPFAKGGSDTVRNIELLCEKCNREKKDNIQ